MSRARKPAADQRAKLSVLQIQQRKNEENSIITTRNDVDPDDPPEELRDGVAKKEWKRILPVLESIELLGDCDRTNLIGYCNAFSKYMQAIKDDDDSKIIRFGDEVRKFEACCYLTPDSRLKAASTKRQTKEQKMEAKFGAI